jgi:16S rRNA (guanine1207-N2)-methyltransferase
MKHYFIENSDLPVDERELPLHIFGHDFRFTTRSGLFSYEKPDAASVLLLETIIKKQLVLSGALLDLGCGYGLIGIVLAKVFSRDLQLTMSDTNRFACDYAKKNAKQNGVQAEIIHSDGFASIDKQFNHITLNPPIHAGKVVMYRLYEESAAHLHPDGALYIVVQKKHGAETMLAFLSQIFLSVQILHKQKGFYIIRCSPRT